METKLFRTPQEVVPKKNVSLDHCWVMGIDIGFSSVKGYAPNKYFCFPSYVKKVDGDMIQVTNEDDILYQDETGTYLVGISAQNQVTSDDTSDSEAEFYTRNRYRSKNFEILAMTAIGIGMMSNQVRQRPKEVETIIQTGLPTAYLVRADIEAITRVMQRPCHYSLRIGNGKWKEYHNDISQVYIMAQPSGTMYSIIIDENGVYLPDAKQTLLKNMMVVDAGYGTFDPYGTVSRRIAVKESLPNLGMLRIFQEASRMVYEEYGEDIRISMMPKYLSQGYFTTLNYEDMTTKDIPIGPYIEKANRLVCMESIAKLKEISNYLRDYELMVLTGGTCEAWLPMYREHFAGMKNLEIIAGNRNDGLPLLYSNVRGYYMLRHMNLKITEKGGVGKGGGA